MRVAVEFEQQDDVWFPLFAAHRRSRSRPAPRRKTQPSSAGCVRWLFPVRQVRRQGCHLGDRDVRAGSPAHARPAVARGRGRWAGDRLRRAPGGRHRRALDLSGRRRGRRPVARAASPRWRTPCGCARPGSVGGRRHPGSPARSSMRCSRWPPVSAGTCSASAPCGSRPTRAQGQAAHKDRAATVVVRIAIGGDMQWRIPFGAMSAANWIGMNASAHMHRYGTTARRSVGSR